MIEDLFTPMHLLIIFAILFLLFGAKRLPELGKSLGHGIREFRGGIAGLSDAAGDETVTAVARAEPLAIAAPSTAADDTGSAAAAEAETVARSDDETVTADPGAEQRAAS